MTFKADLFKLIKLKTTYICMILTIIFSSITVISSYKANSYMALGLQNALGTNCVHVTSMKNIIFQMMHSTDLIIMFLIIMCSVFWISEFDIGTIKLQIMNTKSRSNLLLSKYMTILFTSTLLYFIYLVTSVVTGLFFFKLEPIVNIAQTFKICIFQIVMLSLIISIVMLLSLLIRHKTILITLLFIYPIISGIILMIASQLVDEKTVNFLVNSEPLTLFTTFGINEIFIVQPYRIIFIGLISMLFIGISTIIFKNIEVR